MKCIPRNVQLIRYTVCYFQIPQVSYLLKKFRFIDLQLRKHFCTVASNDNFNVNAKLYPIHKITSDFGLNEKTVVKIMETNPELLNMSSNTWNGVLSIFLNSGFSGHECLQMISMCPKLLKTESKCLQAALECWRNVNLGDNSLISLINACPELLYVNLKDLPKKIAILKSLGSNKNVLDVIRTCPSVVFENCNTLIQKVEYIENEMKISGKKILKCQALGRTLSELKARHVFLVRAGKYVPPNPKADSKEYSSNPSLKQITDTDDLKFATCVAGLTLEEYEVFVELYRTEGSESDIDDD